MPNSCWHLDNRYHAMYLKLPPYDKKLETVLMGSNSIFFNTRNQLQDLPFLTTLFKDFNLHKHIGFV